MKKLSPALRQRRSGWTGLFRQTAASVFFIQKQFAFQMIHFKNAAVILSNMAFRYFYLFCKQIPLHQHKIKCVQNLISVKVARL